LPQFRYVPRAERDLTTKSRSARETYRVRPEPEGGNFWAGPCVWGLLFGKWPVWWV